MNQCYNSIVVPAAADEVWKALRNFHDMSWSANVVTNVAAVGDKDPHEIGAQRKLNDAFEETLLSINDFDRSFSYSIDNGPPPLNREAVATYVGTVKVFRITATNQAFVLWTAEFVTKDDAAVRAFCDPIYQGLLNDLVAHFS